MFFNSLLCREGLSKTSESEIMARTQVDHEFCDQPSWGLRRGTGRYETAPPIAQSGLLLIPMSPIPTPLASLARQSPPIARLSGLLGGESTPLVALSTPIARPSGLPLRQSLPIARESAPIVGQSVPILRHQSLWCVALCLMRSDLRCPGFFNTPNACLSRFAHYAPRQL